VPPSSPGLDYTVEPLRALHDRAAFSCGVVALDDYLRRQARQDLSRNLAAVFVLTADNRTIAGYYTLSAHSILAGQLPESVAKKLPRFPLPVTSLGRMAVSQSLRGQHLGELLLMHALERAWLGSKQVASWAVIVDAKLGARAFYLKYGFAPLPSQPHRLYQPMTAIAKAFLRAH
jgi:predicted GNAT family N-acyltransferase